MTNKEDMDMARMELNEQDVEQVVGGAFNWYYNSEGAGCCYVDGLGNYTVTSSAKDRYAALKLEHKLDKWKAKDYVAVLVAEGYFAPFAN